MVRYPDGVYRSVPPVWNGFLSYYPAMQGSFSGASTSTLYDVYNGANGSANSENWVLGGGWSVLSTNTDNNISNWATAGSYTSLGIIIPQFTFANAGGAYWIGALSTSWTGAAVPYSTGATPPNGSAFFDFGNSTTGRIASSALSVANQFNVWGFLAGGSYQAIYQNGTRIATQASNQTYTPQTGSKNFFFGTNTAAVPYNFTEIQYGAMITTNTLADADYLTLENWFTTVELPRIAPSYANLLLTCSRLHR